jgi:hypothetical protein
MKKTYGGLVYIRMVRRFKEDNLFYCTTKKLSIDAGGARKWNVEV